ncbi:MAG: iron-containing alcohol dehydrogenase [Clostridia bacterium]|nr:iron-containing alcohol dehydrogenase [Clostridia bacterium]
MARFCVPRDVYFGRDTLQTLATLQGERALLVVGEGSLRRGGHVETAAACLQHANMRVRILSGIGADASLREVRNGVKAMRESKPDWIVAMGGGTLLGAAKIMWVLYACPGITLESLADAALDDLDLRSIARFAAIPTTAGTGMEAAGYASIADYAAHKRYALQHPRLTPDIAILDPTLLEDTQPAVAAYTGMDAISHALEACVTPKRTPFSVPLATDALRVLFSSVFPAYKGDATARENAFYAQYLAGMAYSNSALGLTHALAQAASVCLTEPRVPHGCASAILMPQVIRFNAKADPTRYEEMARLLSIKQREGKGLVESMALQLGEISAQMRIPISFSRFGVGADAFDASLPTMAEQAEQASGARENPRPASREQLTKILRCAYMGKPVDF